MMTMMAVWVPVTSFVPMNWPGGVWRFWKRASVLVRPVHCAPFAAFWLPVRASVASITIFVLPFLSVVAVEPQRLHRRLSLPLVLVLNAFGLLVAACSVPIVIQISESSWNAGNLFVVFRGQAAVLRVLDRPQARLNDCPSIFRPTGLGVNGLQAVIVLRRERLPLWWHSLLSWASSNHHIRRRHL